MSNKEQERRQNDTKYGNLVIKTSIEIDMDKGKWTLPCFRSLKKYVIRDQRFIKEKYKEFNNLETLFDDVDKILSVSESFFFFQKKNTFRTLPSLLDWAGLSAMCSQLLELLSVIFSL